MKKILKTVAPALAIVIGIAAAPASAATNIGNFEPDAAAITNSNGYCYFSGAYNAPACDSTKTTWSGTGGGVTSGLQLETNTAWPGAATPDGSAYGFVQSGYGTPGALTTTFSVGSTGTYVLNWLDAGRPGGGGNQGYNILIDNALVGTGATTSGQGFLARNTSAFALAAGTHTISFQALASGGDNAAFIDAVSVSAVPEPSTWALMLFGFGAVGYTMRSRRRLTYKAAQAV